MLDRIVSSKLRELALQLSAIRLRQILGTEAFFKKPRECISPFRMMHHDPGSVFAKHRVQRLEQRRDVLRFKSAMLHLVQGHQSRAPLERTRGGESRGDAFRI